MNDIEPLPEELQSLLAAESSRADPAVELRTQLWTGIATGLGTIPPPSVGRPLPGHGAGPGAGHDALRAAALKIGLGKAVVIGAVAFGVGAGSGVIVDRNLRGPTPAAVEAVPVPAPALPAIPEIAPPAPKLKPVQRPPSKPIETHDGALAAERALLERARAALSRGRPSEAYQAALEHEVDYPQGQLVEERQVLEIQSLVALGRRQEAEQAANAFRESHPRSLLLPALSEALGTPK